MALKKTLTLAKIYENQGLLEDAAQIYREILADDPDNIEAILSLRRLEKPLDFGGANKEMTDFFAKMESAAEFAEFERYLAFN
ncbi:MAG: tetratricopeptide repeat protein [Helicobacteraceae bacterium]|nr:tetratricopeptide repeat protein [Helicobacteraceae bacterium]